MYYCTGNLCIDENNRSKLVESQACEAVIESFKRHMHDVKMGISGSFAIEKLCESKDESFTETIYLSWDDKAMITLESQLTMTTPMEDDNPHESGGSSNQNLSDSIVRPHSNNAIKEQQFEISDPFKTPKTPDTLIPLERLDNTIHTPHTPSSIPMYVRSKLTAKGKFFNYHVHDVLIDALDFHSTNEEAVCQIASAISKLSQGYGGSKHPDRIMFGTKNACPILIKALKCHPSNENVAHKVFVAIGELIKDNRKNKLAVRNNHGCELIIGSLRKFRHTTLGAAIVESACVIIYHLCLNSKTAKLVICDAAGVKVILEAMELYQKSLETIYASCLALYQVCYGAEIAVNTLCLSGAAEILTSIINRYSDVKSVVNVALSVMILMSNQSSLLHQQKLTSSGVAKLLPMLMLKYEKLDSLSMTFCALITILCYKNVKNKMYLSQLGICKIIYSILEKHILENKGSSESWRSRATSIAPSFRVGINKINNLTFDLSNIDITEFTNNLMSERDKSSNTNTADTDLSRSQRMSSIEDLFLPRTMEPYTPSPAPSVVDKAATAQNKPTRSEHNENEIEKSPVKIFNHNLFAEPQELDSNNMITPITRKNTISSSTHKDILIDELENDMFSPFHLYYGITGRDETAHSSAHTNTATSANDIIVEECLRAVGNLIIDCDANKSKMSVSGIADLLKPLLPTSAEAIQSSKLKLISEIYRHVSK